jgi:hypothetical protein
VAACAWREASTPRQAKALLSHTGVRWSALLRLPYFRAARMTLPDPMHCMWLGVGKRLLHELKEECEWNGATLKRMQQVLDDMPVPRDVCRILHNWAANMNALHASQVKVFISSLSAAVFAADGNLSVEQHRMWRHLVIASRILASPYVCVRAGRDHDRTRRGRPRCVSTSRSGAATGTGTGIGLGHAAAAPDDSDSRSDEEVADHQLHEAEHSDDGGRDDVIAVWIMINPLPSPSSWISFTYTSEDYCADVLLIMIMMWPLVLVCVFMV